MSEVNEPATPSEPVTQEIPVTPATDAFRDDETKELVSEHRLDADGNPAGGATVARGVRIQWQDGPLGRGEERKEPNGAFVEDVIRAAADRLEFYQSTKFACDENAQALARLQTALNILQSRTKQRERRGVEGTHEI